MATNICSLMKPHRGKFKKYLTQSNREQVEIGCLFLKDKQGKLTLSPPCKGTDCGINLGDQWNKNLDSVVGSFHTHPKPKYNWMGAFGLNRMSSEDIEFDMDGSDFSCIAYGKRVVCHDYRQLDEKTKDRIRKQAVNANRLNKQYRDKEFKEAELDLHNDLKRLGVMCGFSI